MQELYSWFYFYFFIKPKQYETAALQDRVQELERELAMRDDEQQLLERKVCMCVCVCVCVCVFA